MSYNSPINIISQTVNEQIKEMQKQEETAIMAEITRKIGVDINKDELIRALNYDRNQYEKGFVDGRMSGKNEVESKLVHIGDREMIKYETLVVLCFDEDIANHKELIKRRLCDRIGRYLYDNNLVTFKETLDPLKNHIIWADVQVYNENKEDQND